MGKGSGCSERPALAPVGSERGRRPQGVEDTWEEKDNVGRRGEVQVLRLLEAAVSDARGDWQLYEADARHVEGDWVLTIRRPPGRIPTYLYATVGGSSVYARWELVERLLRNERQPADGSYRLSALRLLRAGGEPHHEADETGHAKLLHGVSAKAYGDPLADYDIRVPVPTDASGSSSPGAGLLHALNIDGQVILEVKTDTKAHRTNNYYSEHGRLTKSAHARMKRALAAGARLGREDFTAEDYEPSALMVSAAPHYVINSGEAGVIVPTSALKKHTEASSATATAGGDNLRSRACLMRLPELLDFAATSKPAAHTRYDADGLRRDLVYDDGDYDPTADYAGHPAEVWADDEPLYSEADVDEFFDLLEEHDLL